MMKIKNITALICCMAMLLMFTPSIPVGAVTLEGKGTEASPFIACDEDTLCMISDFPDAYWQLSNDIEVTSTWSAIGTSGDQFSGTLDGNGYKITGLHRSVAAYTYPRALFMEYNEGTIKNLHLDGTLTIATPYGGGLLADTNYGTIENCSVTGTITVTQSNWTYNQFGGMVNQNHSNGIIKNCYAKVDFVKTVAVASYASVEMGGMVYDNDGTIMNCYTVGTRSVPASISDEIGKGFAYTGDGTSESCYYDKEVSGCSDTKFASGKTTAAMKMEYNYTGWDFDNTWAIDESVNDGYPYLQCERSVDVAVTGFELKESAVTVAEGGTVTLTPVFTPSNASDKTVEWSTSSRYVATVSDGVITGVAEGTATITAVASGFTASCTVTVTNESAATPTVKPTATPTASPTAMPTASPGVYDNKCGDNLTWSYAGGVLIISGTGDMYDYTYNNLPGWVDYADKITAVIVEDGATSVGEWAFFTCDAITMVTLPDTLRSVGAYAFISASSLADVYYGGSSSEWNGITIGSGNDYLKNANINYGSQSDDENTSWYIINSLNYDELDGGRVRIDVSMTRNSGDAGIDTVIIAVYDGSGVMTGCGRCEISIETEQSKTVSVTLNSGKTIKAFVWSSVSSMIPLSETSVMEISGNDDSDNGDYIAQGSCGDNVTWTLDNVGLLTISGSGAMTDYIADYMYEPAPWNEYTDKFITSAVIKDGVTSLGGGALYACGNLSTIEIPSSVERIGMLAVSWTNITELVIPDGVKTIEEEAFEGNSALTTVSIPSSITYIGESAFMDCDSLTNVYYSGSQSDWEAVSIGDYNESLENAVINYNSSL